MDENTSPTKFNSIALPEAVSRLYIREKRIPHQTTNY